MPLTLYLQGLRPIEILMLAYLLPTMGLVLVRRRFLPARNLYLIVRGAAITFVYAQRWIHLPEVLRDWYPTTGYLLLYTEIRYLNRLLKQHFYDKTVSRLEQRLFDGQPSIYMIEQLPYPWLANFFYWGYVLYYPLTPSVLALLYFFSPRGAFLESTFIVMLTFLVCFWIYILFPVASPHYEFPRIGRPHSDLLSYRLITRLLHNGSSKGSAFPSSHVAISTSLLLCLATFQPVVSLLLLPIVLGLTIATVYGRYHYAIDSFAGFIVAIGCYPLGHWLYTLLLM